MKRILHVEVTGCDNGMCPAYHRDQYELCPCCQHPDGGKIDLKGWFYTDGKPFPDDCPL